MATQAVTLRGSGWKQVSAVISKMRLINFKGFEDFTLHFRPQMSLLVGPNNAGKSTIISALRLCSALINVAQRRKPEIGVHDARRDRNVVAYPIGAAQSVGFTDENVRYEFRELESRIELHFKNDAALYVVWPLEDRAYFYLEQIPGAQPPNLPVTRRFYSTIGVIQTLSPVEHREALLSETHVRENLGTRLASRHFRNQLYYRRLKEPDAYAELSAFLLANTPEIEKLSLVESTSSGEMDLDLFFAESGTRTEKEVYWAGDGLQIWLQLLFHIWRQSGFSTLILDEPDVFLHPDLQRRLVNLLEEMNCQVVLATHAPEMLAEANRDAVVIVDRTRKRSKRVNNEDVLSDLNAVLGSGFNLKLAKALRSRVALFVEGKDMRVLRNIARTVGAKLVAQERGLSVVPMGGASKRNLARSFGWLNSAILDSSVLVHVILDRDYLDERGVAELGSEFDAEQVSVHIWHRKELESYLISESGIARVAGIPIEKINDIVDRAVEGLKEYVFSQILSSRWDLDRTAGVNISTVYQSNRPSFERCWSDREWRIGACPAKDLLSSVNSGIQEQGGKVVSARLLSSRLHSHEIPGEMRDLLLEINGKLA